MIPVTCGYIYVLTRGNSIVRLYLCFSGYQLFQFSNSFNNDIIPPKEVFPDF